jgi:hypothetical protein
MIRSILSAAPDLIPHAPIFPEHPLVSGDARPPPSPPPLDLRLVAHPCWRPVVPSRPHQHCHWIFMRWPTPVGAQPRSLVAPVHTRPPPSPSPLDLHPATRPCWRPHEVACSSSLCGDSIQFSHALGRRQHRHSSAANLGGRKEISVNDSSS